MSRPPDRWFQVARVLQQRMEVVPCAAAGGAKYGIWPIVAGNILDQGQVGWAPCWGLAGKFGIPADTGIQMQVNHHAKPGFPLSRE